MDNASCNSLMVQKTAVRFAKVGPAIYHSHHDMIRFWERAVKRAGLPVRFTQGFNPHLRLVFPHALGVGVASRCEEVELELSAPVPLGEVVERVRGAAGDTLEILGAEELPPVKKSRLMVESSYRIIGWGEGVFGGLADACAALMGREEVVVERGAPGKKRSMDIRPYLLEVALAPQGASQDVPQEDTPQEPVVFVRLQHTLVGAARADEVARILAESVGVDVHALAIEKTGMVLE